MKFTQLNHGWNAEPNAPNVNVTVSGADILVSFFLNSFQYPDFKEEDMGVLIFHHCIQYRLGIPNDEGFYIYHQSRYKKYGVKWGEFYVVENSDWKDNFPNPIEVSKQSNEIMNHYLFYFCDETFECIATSYEFLINGLK